MKNIIENLAEIRREKRISQKKMCEHLGVTRVTLSAWENGTTRIPMDKAELYAKYLDHELRLLRK